MQRSRVGKLEGPEPGVWHKLGFVIMFLFIVLFRLAQIFTSPTRFRKSAQAVESFCEPAIFCSAAIIQGTFQKFHRSIDLAYSAAEDFLCSFLPWFALLTSTAFVRLIGCAIIDAHHFFSFWPWWYWDTLFGNGGRSLFEILWNPTCKEMHGTRFYLPHEQPINRFIRWFLNIVPFGTAPPVDKYDYEIRQWDKHCTVLEQKR